MQSPSRITDRGRYLVGWTQKMVELVLSVDQWDETVANEKYVEERNCCERRTHKVIGSSNKNRKKRIRRCSNRLIFYLVRSQRRPRSGTRKAKHVTRDTRHSVSSRETRRPIGPSGVPRSTPISVLPSVRIFLLGFSLSIRLKNNR